MYLCRYGRTSLGIRVPMPQIFGRVDLRRRWGRSTRFWAGGRRRDWTFSRIFSVTVVFGQVGDLVDELSAIGKLSWGSKRFSGAKPDMRRNGTGCSLCFTSTKRALKQDCSRDGWQGGLDFRGVRVLCFRFSVGSCSRRAKTLAFSSFCGQRTQTTLHVELSKYSANLCDSF